MKFGKDFRSHLEGTLPDWKDKYLAYKALKKLIKTLPPDADQPPPPLPPVGHGDGGLGDWFARILDVELHKLNDFYMEREEWYVIRLQVPNQSIPSLPRLRPAPLQRSSSRRCDARVHACGTESSLGRAVVGRDLDRGGTNASIVSGNQSHVNLSSLGCLRIFLDSSDESVVALNRDLVRPTRSNWPLVIPLIATANWASLVACHSNLGG